MTPGVANMAARSAATPPVTVVTAPFSRPPLLSRAAQPPEPLQTPTISIARRARVTVVTVVTVCLESHNPADAEGGGLRHRLAGLAGSESKSQTRQPQPEFQKG